jgi:hypothetical protein
MACRRFAGRFSGDLAVTIKGIAVALAALAAAASLGGCAGQAFGPVPASVEEQLWFDRATGYDIVHVSPELRMRGAIGYPRTDGCCFDPPPPGFGSYGRVVRPVRPARSPQAEPAPENDQQP